MSRYPVNGSRAVDPVPLAVGDLVRLDRDADKWWTVQAVSPNFAACTRPLTNEERAEYRNEMDEYGDQYDEEGPDGPLYTVLDWRNGVRGPCDLIGQSWGDGTYSPAECADMLAAFEVTDDDIRAAIDEHNDQPAGEPKSAPSHLVPFQVHISQRNWLPLRVLEHRSGGAR